MFRTSSLLIVLMAVAIGSPAQVTVTNQGFATTPGAGVPATPVSPPILYTPIVRLDQGQTQPVTVSAIPAQQPEAEPAQLQSAPGQPQPFNFGVARFDSPLMQGGVGQLIDGMSLGDVARKLRGKETSSNTRTYTNADIQNLRQPGSSEAQGTGKSDNWVSNNGVIDPNGIPTEPAQNSVGSPAVSQPAPESNPFGPRAPSATPAPPASPKPRAAAESASSIRLAQLREGTTQADSDQKLPQTATKLPLIGVLGFFSVSMGIFVRYQRSKSK